MADNKIEIKIVVDSKQGISGVSGITDALNKMNATVKPAKSAVDGVSESLSAVKASAVPAVLNIETLNKKILETKPAGLAFNGLSSALDTVKTSSAGINLSNAFKVKMPTDEINAAALAMGNTAQQSGGLIDKLVGIGKEGAGAIGGLVVKFGLIGFAVKQVTDIIGGMFSTIRDGAVQIDIDRVFEIQARKMGGTADNILSQIKASTQNTITDMQAKMLANQAGIAQMSVSDVTTTVAYLREYANATGKSFEQLMTTIFTGLSRGSTLMLDDAGILIDQTDLIAQKERELGRELSALGQKKVIVAEAMRQMSENMDEFGDRTASATTKLDRLTTKFRDFFNNLKKEAVKDLNDTLVLMTGAISAQEKINTLKSKIERHGKAASYDPVNKYLVDKWKKELAQLESANKELVRNSSLEKKSSNPTKKTKPVDIKFKPEDFAIEDDKGSKSDPLASIKNELERLTGEKYRVEVNIATVGMEDVKKRIADEEANYKADKLRLENDRTKENSALTDQALRDLKTVHDLKIKLITLEDAETKRKLDEQHQKRVNDALVNFKLDIDTTASDKKLDEFDRKLAEIKRKLEEILKMEGATPTQKKEAQEEYNRGASAIEQERWQSNYKSESSRNLEKFIATTPMHQYDAEMLRLDNQLGLGALSEDAYEYAKAMLEVDVANGKVAKGIESLGGVITNQDIKGAFDAMTPALSGFLTTFAQTGKIDINGLANGLLKSVQAFAAEKTAELTIQYVYNQVMAIIDPTNADYATKAAEAAAAIPVFAGIVAGSGLAGMAHDGISSLPETGTWLLQKKERIVGAQLNQDLTTFLANQTSNITNTNNSGHNVSLVVNATDGDSVQRVTPTLLRSIENSLMKSDRFRRSMGGK